MKKCYNCDHYVACKTHCVSKNYVCKLWRGWHDLRKNPEDLPKCNGRYIVWRPNYYPHFGAATICYFDGSDAWHDSDGVDFTRMLNKDDVVAWREIEPFGSEENEK